MVIYAASIANNVVTVKLNSYVNFLEWVHCDRIITKIKSSHRFWQSHVINEAVIFTCAFVFHLGMRTAEKEVSTIEIYV